MSSTGNRHIMPLLRLALLAALLAWPVQPAAAQDQAQIQRMVVEEAERAGLSPSLALAVARVESNFQPNAKSWAGARGVMQIMPATAKGVYNVPADELWNPRLNIQLGVDFLKSLIERYDGRWDIALSHYNGGSAVGAAPNLRVIPATRQYVADVLRWHRTYERERVATRLAGYVPPAGAAAQRRPIVAVADAGARTGAPAGYWIHDAPVIDRDWRRYLAEADQWLQLGRARRGAGSTDIAAPGPVAQATTAQADADEPVGARRPSVVLQDAIADLRGRFRQRLATSERPLLPITGEKL